MEAGSRGFGYKLPGPETSAQRLTAVLGEGKFFDEAIHTMQTPPRRRRRRGRDQGPR